MKEFINKLKNSSHLMKFIYLFTTIVYWVSFGFFCKSILSLTDIETTLRIIVLIVSVLLGLLYTCLGLRMVFKKKKIVFTMMTIFTIIFSILFGGASYYINLLHSKLENFETKETSTYTTVLLALKDTEFTESSKIGMITDEEDRTGYLLPLELIKKDNIKNEIEYYSNVSELLQGLYNKEVDAIFVNKDYGVIYSGEEKYQNIVNETKILKEYSREMKTEESELLATTKSLTEPFSVLVLGVDAEASHDGLDANAAFNGDTLMLITFNPKTLTATMLSIPRDTYVPIISSSGRTLWHSKINSSAAYGTASTINTIENITGVEIDYFVKVNFRGVIDLVNALGGIDVDVEQPDYQYYVNTYGEGRLCESNSLRDMTNLVCMNTGWQHLDGDQALAYARNRHGFLESDIARNRHQQQIIEAIAKKLVQTASFSDFEKLLDTVSRNIASNMKTSQILSFYQALKGMLLNALNGEDFITIQKMQLTYYDLDVGGISALGYYEGSMAVITKAMKENLGLLKVEDIKTFSYDYSEDFEQTTQIIGKGIYTGTKLKTMPYLVGETVSYAQNFANKNGLDMAIEYKYDENQIPGIILAQSISDGAIINNITGFTIVVNNPSEEEKSDDEDEKENTSDNNKDNESSEDKSDNESNNENNNDDITESDDNTSDVEDESNDNSNTNKEEEPIIPGTPEEENNVDSSDADNNTNDDSNENIDE